MTAMSQKEDAAAIRGAVAVTTDRKRVSHFSVFSIPQSSTRLYHDATTNIVYLRHHFSYGIPLDAL
jgi:hypothetical protein